MKKTAFLNALKKELKPLKASELQKNISYYDELLSDMMENQLSEEEAVARLGSPQTIAAEILANTAPENFRKKDVPGIVLITLSAVLLLICLFLRWKTWLLSQTTIAIIGGADGPTSIFLAGKIGTPFLIYVITGIVVVATVLYKLWHRNKK